jgi:hypothetical protein
VPVNDDSVNRNRDHIAGDGGHNLQEQLGIGWARSLGKVSAAPTELSGVERCAHRDEGTALNSTLRHRSEAIDSERHARRKIKAQAARDNYASYDDDRGSKRHHPQGALAFPRLRTAGECRYRKQSKCKRKQQHEHGLTDEHRAIR